MAEDKEMANQYFAEYSLWNDSAYSIYSFHPIQFRRSEEDSIFLTPYQPERDRTENNAGADNKNGPGFERYMKRALKIVTKEDLHRDPALFKKDEDSDSMPSHDTGQDPLLLYRPRRRTTQQVTGRGRKKMNLMQRRLEQALSQPAAMERGASMMQRMGWDGGALGRDGVGIVEPIAPDIFSSSTTAGLGHTDSANESGDDSAPESKPTKRTKPANPNQPRVKKHAKTAFKINVLQYIREFVKNDLQIDLIFEPKLTAGDRKRIHRIVSKLMGVAESGIQFNTMEMEYLVQDIKRRNAFLLHTHSEGEDTSRQILVYKVAQSNMYVVTPEDIRQSPEFTEEETNPFLKSIARHLKNDPPDDETQENIILNNIIDYFVDFSDNENYVEFRFLGPFNFDEVEVMSTFLGMVDKLVERQPCFHYPEKLLNIFNNGHRFTTDEDINGFITVKKVQNSTYLGANGDKNCNK